MTENKTRVLPVEASFDVHLGMKRFDATDATVIGTLLSAGVLGHSRREVFVDGDGWEEWGEPPFSASDDGEILHIVVRVQTLADAIHFLDKLVPPTRELGPYGHLLVTAHRDFGHGYAIGAVTSSTDWSRGHYVVTTKGRMTLLATVGGA